MKIPKKIFQTWHRKHNPDVERLTQNWKDLNPEYTHEFFDEEAMQMFMEENFDKDVVECYNNVQNIQLKSDFWRYSVIYVNGGVYVDVDTVPVKPLDDILDTDDDAVFTMTPVPHWGLDYRTQKPIVIMAGAFIAATPKHPILLHMIDGICSSIRNNEFPEQIHELSGTERIISAIYNYCDVRYIEPGYIPNITENIKILKHPVNLPDEVLDTHETITTINGEIAIKTQIPVHEEESKQHYGYFHENALSLYEMTAPTFEDIIRLESALLTRYIWDDKVRVGRDGDGGYVIADGLQYDLLIAGGIAGDISFEEDLLQRHPNIMGYGFDGTVEEMPNKTQDRLTLIKKNIGIHNNDTLTDLVEYVGECKDVFLKLDIEGAEFDWILSSAADFNKFKQIVIEMHPFGGNSQEEGVLDIGHWQTALRCIRKLNTTHRLVHIHGNNAPTIGGGTFGVPAPEWYSSKYGIKKIELPRVPELTFVRKSDMIINERCVDPIPSPIDQPNFSNLPETVLTGYPWT